MSSDNKQSLFINSALTEHNKWRKLHGVGNLTHNPELSKIALNWAKNLVAQQRLQHSSNKYKNNSLGENLYCASGYGDIDYGLESTKSWYNEIKNYNWNNPSFGMNTGHFTQVVWKNSKEFGLGVAIGSDGTVYVCANYYPPGNFNNAYSENVFPANGQSHKSNSINNNNPPKNHFDNDNNNNKFGGTHSGAHGGFDSGMIQKFDWSEPKFNMSTGQNQNFNLNSFGNSFPVNSNSSSRSISKSSVIKNGKKVVTTKVVENGEETVTIEEFEYN